LTAVRSEAARIAVVVVCDAVFAAVGAWLLWHSGGATVVTGTLIMQVTFLVACAIAVVARHLAGASRQGRDRARTLRAERTVILIEVLVLAGTTGVWLWLWPSDYYLGWQIAFAAVALVVGAALQLVGDVTTGRNRSASAPRTRSARRGVAVENVRLASVAVGGAALVATARIHEWDPLILSPLVVLIALAYGVGTGLHHLVRPAIRSTRSTS
jgi:hypothetical protein